MIATTQFESLYPSQYGNTDALCVSIVMVNNAANFTAALYDTFLREFEQIGQITVEILKRTYGAECLPSQGQVYK